MKGGIYLKKGLIQDSGMMTLTNIQDISSFSFQNLICETLVIPETVINITFLAFSHCKIRNIVFLGDTQLEQDSFFECEGLENIYVSADNLEKYKRNRFKYFGYGDYQFKNIQEYNKR